MKVHPQQRNDQKMRGIVDIKEPFVKDAGMFCRVTGIEEPDRQRGNQQRKGGCGSQSKRFVDQLFGSDMAAFANALTSSGLSREDLKELRRLLEEDAL